MLIVRANAYAYACVQWLFCDFFSGVESSCCQHTAIDPCDLRAPMQLLDHMSSACRPIRCLVRASIGGGQWMG